MTNWPGIAGHLRIPLNKMPYGDYLVPTYDFGDIMHLQSTARDLSFGLYVPAAPTDPLAIFLEEAAMSEWDVFMNRTTSLKISEYVDSLVRDDGTPYPIPPLSSSDVSVFFIPEPATICILGLGALSLIRRKK